MEPMRMDTIPAGPLLTALEQLAPHNHLCSIYESPAEHLAVAIPFVRIGLDRGEKCLYIADDGTETMVLEAMCASGIDVERAISSKSLVLVKKEDAYLKHGSFDPDWMFTFWTDATADAMSQGYTALRATGETEWVLRGGKSLEHWLAYESRVTHTLAHHNCVVLCQYNRRLFPPELILDVIRTHPTVIYRGVVCRNMYYVPADELRGADRSAREVERLLTNIREREEIETTLTEQRNELRENEERFRRLVELMPVAVYVCDTSGVIQHYNNRAVELWGRAPRVGDQAQLYCGSLRLYARDGTLVPHDQSEMAEVLRTGKEARNLEVIVERPDGSRITVLVNIAPLRSADGRLLGAMNCFQDITDRKRAEEQLRRSERLLRLVLDALPVAVSVVDHAADIILTNPSAQRLWSGSIRSGQERYAESKGWRHDTGKRLAPAEWPSARAILTGETSVNEVIEIEAFDGARKIIQTSAVPIRDTDDRITGAVIVNEDISAREHAKKELNDSYNQMRTLTGRLMQEQDDERRRISQMLHETTAQDLAAVKMHLARLNRTAGRLTDAERAALTESISLAEQSMTQIRTLSYLLHPPFLDETGLLSALRWYANGFSERSGIVVDLELPESFERLPLDTETALFRIVQESLINIHRHAGSATARIRLTQPAGTLLLEIHDQGRGIPKASLTRISSRGGFVGVGIAGMIERMEQLGGRLEIASGDRGTTIRVLLPS
jgi:signal transduction histidine kinase